MIDITVHKIMQLKYYNNYHKTGYLLVLGILLDSHVCGRITKKKKKIAI